ncbi:hypothetical protein GCM10022221_65050 [Actinocorallia aurea]
MSLVEEVLEDRLSEVFAALADPTRRAIVARLAGGEATVGQLAEPFALTQQAVSKHLKVLEEAGLVARAKVGRTRPCALRPEPLDRATGWMVRHRALWEERHDNLAAYLSELRAGLGEGAGTAGREAGEPAREGGGR